MESSGARLEFVCAPLPTPRQACLISQNRLQNAALTNTPLPPNLSVLTQEELNSCSGPVKQVRNKLEEIPTLGVMTAQGLAYTSCPLCIQKTPHS